MTSFGGSPTPKKKQSADGKMASFGTPPKKKKTENGSPSKKLTTGFGQLQSTLMNGSVTISAGPSMTDFGSPHQQPKPKVQAEYGVINVEGAAPSVQISDYWSDVKTENKPKIDQNFAPLF